MKERPTLTAKKSRRAATTTSISTGSTAQPAVGNGHDPAEAATRHELISTEAYLRAAQRGFEPGHELDDWLAAETLVELRLHEPPTADSRT